MNSLLSRSQYSDKSIPVQLDISVLVLPCGLSVAYTPLFLGRASEKA